MLGTRRHLAVEHLLPVDHDDVEILHVAVVAHVFGVYQTSTQGNSHRVDRLRSARNGRRHLIFECVPNELAAARTWAFPLQLYGKSVRNPDHFVVVTAMEV